MSNTLLYSYRNGNYDVNIYDDGTKERLFTDAPIPEFPESMDVKVTDYCDANCRYCHESSTVKGIHSDEELAVKLFDGIPNGTELAIGGGNPLAWDGIYYFLGQMTERKLICNMTVNAVHVARYIHHLESLIEDKNIYGLGLSYNKTFIDVCAQVANANKNTVFHVIMGVHTLDDVKLIIEKVKNPKILLLGYKQYGRGLAYHSPAIESQLYRWYVQIHEFFNKEGLVLSFDNLAIRQLNLRRFFTEKNWNEFYMGDDGKFTFFLDLVKKQYCRSSTTSTRFNIDTQTIRDMFAHIRSL